MDEFKKFLLPVVKGQVLDAIAQPSFGKLSSGGPNTSVLARIDLDSNKSNFNIGENFKVKIKITSFEDLFLDRVILRILYNPNILSVVDSNPNVSGTQINVTNPNFSLVSQTDNNVNTLEGVITLILDVQNQINFKSGIEIAEIEFNTQSQGLSRITIQTGSQGSRLVRNAQSVSYTSSELQISVSNLQSTITISPTTVTPTPTLVLPTPTKEQIQQTPTPVVDVIPETSVNNNMLIFFINLFVGFLILLLGFNLRKKISKTKKY